MAFGNAFGNMNQRRFSPATKRRKGVGAEPPLELRWRKPFLEMNAAIDSESFVKAAVKLLEAAVQCDIVHVLLHYYMDHGRSTLVWGSKGQDYTPDFVKASMLVNPHWPHLARNPGLKVWLFSSNYASPEEMERCPYYIGYIKGIGVRHAVALLFWNETLDASNFILAPNRTEDKEDFTPEELELLEQLHTHIDVAYKRVQRLENAACARKGMERFLEMLPLPMVLVDWNLTPVFHSSPAARAAATWSGRSPHEKEATNGFVVPEDIRSALSEMREGWACALRMDFGSVPFQERVLVHSTRPGCRAHISMTSLGSTQFGEPSFVVRFESGCELVSGGTGEGKLNALTRLSPAERTIALMVCDGKSNQEIADALGRSLSTVKSQIYAIFKKLGIASRTRLVALMR